MINATLAFRGYPQQINGVTSGDLTYDYKQMSPTGPFIPQRGAYTHYGDVTPLLQRIDDEYVIFGTGEDMDLEFERGCTTRTTRRIGFVIISSMPMDL